MSLRPGERLHEWFKLGLCPEFENRREQGSELARKYPSPTALPKVNDAQCKKLVIDYLNSLKTRLDDFLRQRQLHQIPRQYIVTVPAVWTHGAQDLTRKCAQKAGMGNANDLQVISEPEAAGIFALQNMDTITMRDGDTFVICDAGGG